MRTKTVGELLKSYREERQVSVDDLARITKIKSTYLQFLENNQFDSLPAAPFVKGYIKSYGQVLGFDHRPLLAMLRRDFNETNAGKIIPRSTKSIKLKDRWWFIPNSLPFRIGAVVALVVFMFIAVQWWRFQQPPQLEVLQPENNQVVGPKIVVSGKTDLDATVAVNTQPAALQADGSFQTEIFLSREGPVTITIESTDRRGKTKIVQRNLLVEF